MDVNGKQVVVLGLGISGMEAAKLLQDHGAEVTVRDDAAASASVSARAATLRGRGVTVELGGEFSSTARFDFGVLSPGIKPTAPLVRSLGETPIFGELELAYRFC